MAGACALVLLASVAQEMTAIGSGTNMKALYMGPLEPPPPGEAFDMGRWLKSAMPKREIRCKGADTGKDVAGCSTEQPLGMEDGRIPDGSLSASSVYYNNATLAGPQKSRLHFAGGFIQCWCADGQDTTPWIQVDFNSQVYITGLITQGCGDMSYWLMRYNVSYSDDYQNWHQASNANGSNAEFVGNVDKHSLVTARFEPTVYARYLRIVPTSAHGSCYLRFEVLGC